MITNVIFDLDGTLTDPAEGIVRCIQYSLGRLSIRCPAAEELTQYIGPPLRDTFASICGTTDKQLVEQAISIFRERFSTTGLFENSPYPQVPKMLASLHRDFSLFIATSKPQVFAARILDHFSLAEYFNEIQGNDMEGRLDDKAEMLKELIHRRELRATETIMVGDRMHDVLAAKKNNVMSLGVTYGYGSKKELVDAGVQYLCTTPMEVVTQVRLLGSQTTVAIGES